MADNEPILAAIAELRAAMLGRMDQLQASIDAIRDDITVLGGANDRTRLAAPYLTRTALAVSGVAVIATATAASAKVSPASSRA